MPDGSENVPVVSEFTIVTDDVNEPGRAMMFPPASLAKTLTVPVDVCPALNEP